MDWIKVTPDTMPPEGEEVLVTVDNYGYSKETLGGATYTEYSGWMVLCGSDEGAEPIYGKVTHWMPYPAPAED